MTACLEDKFGAKMLTHRAGRRAFNETYARLLADFGYIYATVRLRLTFPGEARWAIPAGGADSTIQIFQ
jgi:hypothetical protein